MPRVFRKTKNRGGHKEYRCSAPTCLMEKDGGSRVILAGEEYYTWKFNRGARFFRHAACGIPSRGELTNSKMGPLWDAVDQFDVSGCGSADEIKEALESVAQDARSVAEEYIDSADNIEQAFPSGNPTSEACRATGEELEAWADELESWEPDNEWDPEEHEEDERDDQFEAWLGECRDAATELISNAPEYQG